MSYAPACDNIKQPSSFLGNVRPKGHNRGIGMRKLFVGIFAIALIAVSLFAFVACDEDGVALAESEKKWYADGEMFWGIMSARFSIVSETEWQVNTVMGDNEYADPSQNENPMWCRGTYSFDGVPGQSDLHITLMETWPGDDDYDPSNVRLLDANKNVVDFGTEVVLSPNEKGQYMVMVQMPEQASLGDLSIFFFTFEPPQELGGFVSGEDVYAPPAEGNPLGTIIGVTVAIVVVIVAAIVVTVVLVKKNKKKKAAAAAAESGAGETFPGDDSEA